MPEDGQHVFLLDHLDEGGQVKEGGELGSAVAKVKLIGARLVEVPRDIHINSVKTSSLPWCGFIFVRVLLGHAFNHTRLLLAPLSSKKHYLVLPEPGSPILRMDPGPQLCYHLFKKKQIWGHLK